MLTRLNPTMVCRRYRELTYECVACCSVLFTHTMSFVPPLCSHNMCVHYFLFFSCFTITLAHVLHANRNMFVCECFSSVNELCGEG